jgi:uncharacterized protein involved in outer membrane biogenesis
MPIVAVVAMAIAVTETNNPRNAIKALSREKPSQLTNKNQQLLKEKLTCT